MRKALAAAYQRLGAAGLIAGSSGNVSARHGAEMLISPSGTTPERITPDALIDTPLDSPAPGASSEWALHGAIYAARPELHAIVHTHADACTALACLNEPLPAFHYGIAAFGGGDVRCAPYTTFGTQALADLAVTAMNGRTACLLANHGMIAAATTLDAAIAHAFELERLARQYLLARAAGTPRLLSAEELTDAQARFATYQKATATPGAAPVPFGFPR